MRVIQAILTATGMIVSSAIFISGGMIPFSAMASSMTHGHMEADPLLMYISVDELEARQNDQQEEYTLDLNTWVGRDLNKFWAQLDLDASPEELEKVEFNLFYQRAFSAYWHWELGLRVDDFKGEDRPLTRFALTGLAPYFIETTWGIFIDEEGAWLSRLSLEYDLNLTRRWLVHTAWALNYAGQDQPLINEYAGLNESEFSLRLEYQKSHALKPYVGMHWQQWLGKASDAAASRGEGAYQVSAVVGLSFWY